MDQKRLINTNIAGQTLLPTPRELHALLPADDKALETVARGRQAIRDILDGKDDRLLLIAGPCSIHDPEAALEYAHRLRDLADQVSQRFLIAMRVYFEKPRTTVGWKGLINDPFMNDSFHIEHGLKAARELLLKITNLGLPTATEALDPIVPQYVAELVSWHAIGARTIESQTHREMASGLSSPVGFKNGTDGNIQVAIDAMKSALTPHHFLGIDPDGRTSVFKTRGNGYSHMVLRGGKAPNYDAASVGEAALKLSQAGLRPKIMIDCSHGNSNKDHAQQPAVFKACMAQAEKKGSPVMGMMLESHLHEGNQPIPKDLTDPKTQLKYGVSVTDKCLDWDTTRALILASA